MAARFACFLSGRGVSGCGKRDWRTEIKKEGASMNSRTVESMLFASILCLAVVISVPLRAQVTGATLSGTISDAQGGAIPNANISAKNVATGISTDTTTNATGAYSIPNLNPADYEVSVSAPGFSTSVVKVTLT